MENILFSKDIKDRHTCVVWEDICSLSKISQKQPHSNGSTNFPFVHFFKFLLMHYKIRKICTQQSNKLWLSTTVPSDWGICSIADSSHQHFSDKSENYACYPSNRQHFQCNSHWLCDSSLCNCGLAWGPDDKCYCVSLLKVMIDYISFSSELSVSVNTSSQNNSTVVSPY